MALNHPNLGQAELWRALASLKSSKCYGARDLVFREGDPCAGIYLVEVGEINLLLRARKQQYRVLETAGAGAVLGLCEAMSGTVHKLTAEATGPVQVSYIERMSLMHYLAGDCAACMQIVAQLSEDLHGLYHLCRALPLFDSKVRNKTVTH